MKPEEEIKLLQDAWIKLWHTYITWFTWHFAINITIIAGLVSLPALQKQGRLPLFILLSFASLGLGATVAMIRYEMETRQRAEELVPGLSWTVFGGPLSRYAGIATFLTNALLISVWLYLIVSWPLVPPQSN